ncbi:MAG: crotonase/enoyl-CoA hydratase family protein [Defluviimonas sp.]|nr:crotonase/enoyl-CoA hydratase family protein [Defluviimonas sp.]
MTDLVLTEIEDGIATLTLNRPEARNAVNVALGGALRAALDRVEADPSIRIGILCGAGAAFSAGLDLKAVAAGQVQEVLEGEGGFGGLVRRVRTKPLIAAVGGPALAGGFELALACDMIVAGPGARFGLPEPKRGLIAAAGGVFRLASRIPAHRAAEILLTGRIIDLDEAYELGLISRRSKDEDPLPAAVALAREIVAAAPLAVTATLALMRAAERALEPMLWAENDRLFAPIIGSTDAREGAVAFAEHRSPRWHGR